MNDSSVHSYKEANDELVPFVRYIIPNHISFHPNFSTKLLPATVYALLSTLAVERHFYFSELDLRNPIPPLCINPYVIHEFEEVIEALILYRKMLIAPVEPPTIERSLDIIMRWRTSGYVYRFSLNKALNYGETMLVMTNRLSSGRVSCVSVLKTRLKDWLRRSESLPPLHFENIQLEVSRLWHFYSLKRRVFTALSRKTRLRAIGSVILVRNRQFRQRELLLWMKRESFSLRLQRTMQKTREAHFLRRCFAAWRIYALSQQEEKRRIVVLRSRILRRQLQHWYRLTQQRLRMRALLLIHAAVVRRCALRALLHSLRAHALEEAAKERLVRRHQLQKAYHRWRMSAVVSSRLRLCSAQLAASVRLRTLRQCLHRWRRSQEWRSRIRTEAELFQCKSRHFSAWRAETAARIARREALARLSVATVEGLLRLRKICALRRWREESASKVKLRKLEDSCRLLARKRLLEGVVCRWRAATARKSRQRAAATLLRTFVRARMLRNVVSNLRPFLEQRRRERAAAVALQALRPRWEAAVALRRWRWAVQHQVEARALEEAAEGWGRRRVLLEFLNRWRLYASSRLRLRALAAELERRRAFRTRSMCLRLWLTVTGQKQAAENQMALAVQQMQQFKVRRFIRVWRVETRSRRARARCGAELQRRASLRTRFRVLLCMRRLLQLRTAHKQRALGLLGKVLTSYARRCVLDRWRAAASGITDTLREEVRVLLGRWRNLAVSARRRGEQSALAERSLLARAVKFRQQRRAATQRAILRMWRLTAAHVCVENDASRLLQLCLGAPDCSLRTRVIFSAAAAFWVSRRRQNYQCNPPESTQLSIASPRTSLISAIHSFRMNEALELLPLSFPAGSSLPSIPLPPPGTEAHSPLLLLTFARLRAGAVIARRERELKDAAVSLAELRFRVSTLSGAVRRWRLRTRALRRRRLAHALADAHFRRRALPAAFERLRQFVSSEGTRAADVEAHLGLLRKRAVLAHWRRQFARAQRERLQHLLASSFAAWKRVVFLRRIRRIRSPANVSFASSRGKGLSRLDDTGVGLDSDSDSERNDRERDVRRIRSLRKNKAAQTRKEVMDEFNASLFVSPMSPSEESRDFSRMNGFQYSAVSFLNFSPRARTINSLFDSSNSFTTLLDPPPAKISVREIQLTDVRSERQLVNHVGIAPTKLNESQILSGLVDDVSVISHDHSSLESTTNKSSHQKNMSASETSDQSIMEKLFAFDDSIISQISWDPVS